MHIIKVETREKIKSISNQTLEAASKLLIGNSCPKFTWFQNSQHQNDSFRKIGVVTITGKKIDNPDWINQDSFLFDEGEPPLQGEQGNDVDHPETRNVYSIFDGHGPLGHFVSRYCSENIMRVLNETNFILPMTFETLQQELQYGKININTSGTTCTVIVVENGNKLKIANVGDSRAVLARRDHDSDGSLVPIALSFEHSPEKPEEAKRIVDCGGSVYCRHVSQTQHKTNCGVITTPVLGPSRVWFPVLDGSGRLMGLAMTRSLGDYCAHQVGVVTEPHIFEHTIEETDELVILASDGLWDMLAYEDCMYLIRDFMLSLDDPKQWDAQEAAEILATSARKKWEKFDAAIDDITCMVIRLNL